MKMFIVSPDTLEVEDLVEGYSSIIWVDKFREIGTFELCFKSYQFYSRYAKKGYYLIMDESEHFMVIESIKVEDSIEDGVTIIISGRSGESLINRRIIWQQTSVQKKLYQETMKLLFEKCFTSPDGGASESVYRKVDYLLFVENEDPVFKIKGTEEDKKGFPEVSQQWTGDNLLDILLSFSEEYNCGFKLTMDLQEKEMYFELYTGQDRSLYSEQKYQIEYDDERVFQKRDNKPPVIFSEELNNLADSSSEETVQNFSNVALVAGEGEGETRKTVIVFSHSGDNKYEFGFNRRELYVDARDLQKATNDDLFQRGKTKLAEYKILTNYTGGIINDVVYKYDRDYFLGDRVQINRPTGEIVFGDLQEFTYSQDENGISKYPTFTFIPTFSKWKEFTNYDPIWGTPIIEKE